MVDRGYFVMQDFYRNHNMKQMKKKKLKHIIRDAKEGEDLTKKTVIKNINLPAIGEGSDSSDQSSGYEH